MFAVTKNVPQAKKNYRTSANLNWTCVFCEGRDLLRGKPPFQREENLAGTYVRCFRTIPAVWELGACQGRSVCEKKDFALS